MKPYKDVFTVIECNNCQLYELGDVFTLTDKAITVPEGKICCLILVREMTQLMLTMVNSAVDERNSRNGSHFTCSGCSGLIKFTRLPAEEGGTVDPPSETRLSDTEQILFNKIVKYPLLRDIPTNHLKEFINCFKVVRVKQGGSLIQKGKAIKHLFILLTGSAIVEDGGVPIAKLGEGEVCGEMSYFGNNTASTSVKALENCEILAISGYDLGRLIKVSDSVHAYMVRLLAKRLANANSIRVADFDFSMQGRINEMTPAELLQIFHMHQKTGTLSLELPQGGGQISFLDGAIVLARYGKKRGQDAVFAILSETDGIYSFTNGLPETMMKDTAIGDFMMLLMEGVRRKDEG